MWFFRIIAVVSVLGNGFMAWYLTDYTTALMAGVSLCCLIALLKEKPKHADVRR